MNWLGTSNQYCNSILSRGEIYLDPFILLKTAALIRYTKIQVCHRKPGNIISVKLTIGLSRSNVLNMMVIDRWKEQVGDPKNVLSGGILVRQELVVQSLSHVRLFENPWAAARQASLSTTNS